ncbi:MAG: DegT/DnrJ/EryC1/StrS family aminotransferase [Verrucomicrobia bacterium]|nr:DegT/DnrJ/EryC1/StrS family aminotransferase [Verrucomicrobiota bacterium]
MSKLAYLGGTPVAKTDFMGESQLVTRADLERKYLLETYDSGVWDDWPEVPSMASEFQREWAEFNGSKYCALLTNGTHTLQLALETLGVGFGDEVIVPGLTWQATASVCCDVNAVPVLVDVDPDTLCMDPEKVEAAITPRTRVIIPVHLYHRMADMDRLMRIARKHKLHVIEDCAHTHGSQWDGKGAGTLGDFGSYSFQTTKLIKSAEGGALLTQKEDYYLRVVSQRSCGREFKKGVKVHSGNYRITSFQAAILRGQLAAMKVNAPVIDRNGLALDEAVAAAPGVAPLRRNKHITRQCGYRYVFLYDKDAYDGLDGATFREALSAELGRKFDTTYTPLNHSEVYYPHTKQRHHLSKSYVKAITPARWKLPVCEDLWKDRAIVADWSVYGTAPSRAPMLADAIAKIHEHRADLLAAQRRRR